MGSVTVKLLTKTIEAICPACRGTGRVAVKHRLVSRAGESQPVPWGEKTKTRLAPRCISCNGSGKTKQKLISYDGVQWQMDFRKAKRRFQAAVGLHGEKWKKKKGAQLDKLVARGKRTKFALGRPVGSPVILPVTHVASTFLGKDRGKQQKSRRNLKPRSAGRELMTPKAHSHRCPGENHRGERKFQCSCDQPKKVIKTCGLKFCLFD